MSAPPEDFAAPSPAGLSSGISPPPKPPPGFEPAGAAAATTVFVTLPTAEALAGPAAADLAALRRRLRGEGVSAAEAERRVVARAEGWLDRGFGGRPLRPGAAVDVVMRTLLKYQHVRYQLAAAVVMPNHVHLLVRADAGPLGPTLRRLTSSIAKRLCDVTDVPVPLWGSDEGGRRCGVRAGGGGPAAGPRRAAPVAVSSVPRRQRPASGRRPRRGADGPRRLGGGRLGVRPLSGASVRPPDGGHSPAGQPKRIEP